MDIYTKKKTKKYEICQTQGMYQDEADIQAQRVVRGENVAAVSKETGLPAALLQIRANKIKNAMTGKECLSCRYAHEMPGDHENILCDDPYTKGTVIMPRRSTCGFYDGRTAGERDTDAVAEFTLNHIKNKKERGIAALWLASADKTGFAQLYNYLTKKNSE